MNLTLQEMNKALFGLSKEEARAFIKKHKGTMRIYIEDGKEYYGYTDKLVNRVDVEVKSGKVVGVLDIG